jgi:pimeloyl-ACP methyl ester carboxylesterase
LSAQPDLSSVTVRGHRLEVRRIAGASAGAPTLVFLHEGLGSISMWRDFPARAAQATGCPALIYSRAGYGNSDAVRAPRAVRYMHDEALETLPRLLDELGVREPVLVGHSDGASIALIHAGALDRVKGLIVMAPHVFVEDVGVASIARAKAAYETTDLRERLARHHADPEAAFRGWNDIWLHPDFRAWNIEEYLSRIDCPVLAIQGFDDEYGTMAQIDAVARQVSGPVELLRLDRCGHSPHRDQPAAVLEAMTRFVARLGGGA